MSDDLKATAERLLSILGTVQVCVAELHFVADSEKVTEGAKRLIVEIAAFKRILETL